MKKHTFRKKYLFIVLPLGLTLLLFSGKTDSQEPASISLDLYAQLKDQIKKEVKSELQEEMSSTIEELVKEQVQRQWESYLAEHSKKLWEQHAQATKDFTFSEQPKVYNGETIDAAVQRMVRDVFESGEFRQYISDHDLNQVVAGSGIPNKVPIGGGLYKHPTRESFELAKAAAENGKISGKKLKEDDKNWLLVGGEEEQPESIELTLIEKGSVLLPKGQLQLETSTSWAHFSSNNINIQGFLIADILAIGNFATEEIKRDLIIQSFSAKYGVLGNLQAEVKLPFRWQYNRNTISQTSERSDSDWGLGDLEVGISRQIAWEEGWLPDLIAAINFKTKTGDAPYNREIGLGTGHYSTRASLIWAKSSDPAVLFGSLSYTQNYKSDVDNIGEVNPGDSIGYSVGMAIALSYQTAINFSFDQTLVDKVRIDGDMVNGSLLNSASVKIGANWAFNEKSSMDFGVSFGVTDDAPDVTVDVRFPYLF